MEIELVKQCQRGDLNAFKKLYDRHHQSMLRVAWRMLGNQHDAEDAVQTAFIKAFRGVRHFRFQSRFSTWLFQILTNVCFDAIRTQKKHQAEDIDLVQTTTEPQTDLKIQLEQAIAALPERMRLCFILFAVEEFKIEEIAGIMDLSIGGVKSTLFQARVRLRNILSDD
jgi:RNA polymerase sigma-70 factor (ECF subfamily)